MLTTLERPAVTVRSTSAAELRLVLNTLLTLTCPETPWAACPVCGPVRQRAGQLVLALRSGGDHLPG